MQSQNWIKRHSTAIIIVLVLLLGFKSCQSCSRDSAAQYNQQQTEIVIDSVTTSNKIYISLADQLRDSIRYLNRELDILREQLGDTKRSLRNSQSMNSNLINTIKAR